MIFFKGFFCNDFSNDFFSQKTPNFPFRTNNEFLIESQKLDGTNRTLILKGQGHSHSLSYDWVGNNIFWATSRKIEVFSLAHPNITKTLIRTLNAGFVDFKMLIQAINSKQSKILIWHPF